MTFFSLLKSLQEKRLFIALFLCFSGCQIPEPSDDIVLISVDTLRADYLGAYGHIDAYSPMMDSLAQSGNQFFKVITSIPHTTPSHASIMTGLFPMHHGSRDNGIPVTQETHTLAEALQKNGYTTGGFTAHFLLSPECSGLEKGFDIYRSPPRPEYFDLPQENKKIFPIHSNESLSASQVNLEVFKWIETISTPFFLFVHYYDCHQPYQPASPFNHLDTGSAYAQEVASVDHAIHDLLVELEKSGHLKHTIVHIVADHGESLGEHHIQGHGRNLYYPALEIPWIFRDFSHETQGMIHRNQVRSIDIAPSIASQLHIPLHHIPDGSDVVGNEPLSSSMAFSESATGWQKEKGKRIRSIRTDRYTYIFGPDSGIDLLFDRETDPGEVRNQAQFQPAVRDILRDRLEEWKNQDHQNIVDPLQVLDSGMIKSLQALGYLETEAAPSESKPQAKTDP
jgi:arylsulfatase A-like enzyme